MTALAATMLGRVPKGTLPKDRFGSSAAVRARRPGCHPSEWIADVQSLANQPALKASRNTQGLGGGAHPDIVGLRVELDHPHHLPTTTEVGLPD
jgi:hypothetical protein